MVGSSSRALPSGSYRERQGNIVSAASVQCKKEAVPCGFRICHRGGRCGRWNAQTHPLPRMRPRRHSQPRPRWHSRIRALTPQNTHNVPVGICEMSDWNHACRRNAGVSPAIAQESPHSQRENAGETPALPISQMPLMGKIKGIRRCKGGFAFMRPSPQLWPFSTPRQAPRASRLTPER